MTGITMTVSFYFSLYLNGGGGGGGERQTRRQRHTNATPDEIAGGSIGRRTSNCSTSGITTPVDNDDDRRPLLSATVRRPPQKNFLKSAILYQNALLYVFSRLFMTTALVYIPLWLDERSSAPITDRRTMPSTDASVEHIATVPLISFLASFIAAVSMNHATRCIGHKVAYSIGSLISVVGCVWVVYGASATVSAMRLYAIAILFGAGSSITMVASLCITADMIGRHSDQGGFIYSAVTFADKLITGLVVIVIETLKCDTRKQCPEYYRNVLSYACGTAAILGLITLVTIQCNNQRRTHRNGGSSTGNIGRNVHVQD